MFDWRWGIKFTGSRDLSSSTMLRLTGRKCPGVIRVEAGTVGYADQRKYWSVTATVSVRAFGWESSVSAGCQHDLVSRYWPDLKPVIDLHLSDADTGEPMHAEANAWYALAGYYGGAGEQYHAGGVTKDPESCLQQFADHVRIDLPAARMVAESIRTCGRDDASDLLGVNWAECRAVMGAWLNTMRTRWQAQADHARAVIVAYNAAKGPKIHYRDPDTGRPLCRVGKVRYRPEDEELAVTDRKLSVSCANCNRRLERNGYGGGRCTCADYPDSRDQHCPIHPTVLP